MYNAARPAPVSLCGFLWSLFGQWSPPTRCLVFPPLHILPSGETWSTRCLFTFFQPHSLQTSHKRSVGQLNFCCPHVWLESAHTATFMTVFFYCWCPTGRGNLIMWVTQYSWMCICVSGGAHQLVQEHWVLKLASAVKGCRCYQPAQPVMCVWGRWKGRLKMDWEW